MFKFTQLYEELQGDFDRIKEFIDFLMKSQRLNTQDIEEFIRMYYSMNKSTLTRIFKH